MTHEARIFIVLFERTVKIVWHLILQYFLRVLKLLINPTQFIARRIEHEKLPEKIFYSFSVGLLLELYKSEKMDFQKKPIACFIQEGNGKPVPLHLPCNKIHSVLISWKETTKSTSRIALSSSD